LVPQHRCGLAPIKTDKQTENSAEIYGDEGAGLTTGAGAGAGGGASHVSLRFSSRNFFALYRLYAVLPVVQSEISEMMRVIQWSAPSVLNDIHANKRVTNNMNVPKTGANARVATASIPVTTDAFELKYLVLPSTVTDPQTDGDAIYTGQHKINKPMHPIQCQM
jgi:hypothetical protein